MIRIKPLGIENYQEMVEVWKKAGLPYKPMGRDSEEETRRQMSEFGDLFLGAFEEDKLVAVIIGTDDGRKGWINRLAVLPEYRRKGTAMKLIRALEAALWKRGRRIIAVLVETPNDPSLSLFRKAGYLEWHGMVYLSKRESSEV